MESEASTTATAVLALLDARSVVEDARVLTAAARGAEWLRSAQDEEGCIGTRRHSAWTYGHAMATLALCAMQRAAPTAERLQAITRAAAFVEHIHNPYKGWRYGIQDGDNDAKMTSLMLLALHEAARLGVRVDRDIVQAGLAYVRDMEDPRTGRVGWTRRGEPVGRLAETWKSHPPELSEEVTALACVARLAWGEDLGSEPLQRSISCVFRRLPEWDEERGTIDYAYWYWGSRLMRRVGGVKWVAWRAVVGELLVAHAAPAGSDTIWPLVDAWSLPGLEVYANATCVRTLCALR